MTDITGGPAGRHRAAEAAHPRRRLMTGPRPRPPVTGGVRRSRPLRVVAAHVDTAGGRAHGHDRDGQTNG